MFYLFLEKIIFKWDCFFFLKKKKLKWATNLKNNYFIFVLFIYLFIKI